MSDAVLSYELSPTSDETLLKIDALLSQPAFCLYVGMLVNRVKKCNQAAKPGCTFLIPKIILQSVNYYIFLVQFRLQTWQDSSDGQSAGLISLRSRVQSSLLLPKTSAHARWAFVFGYIGARGVETAVSTRSQSSVNLSICKVARYWNSLPV